jgi:myosin-1
MCRAIWDFTGQSKGEMSIKKGETVIIVRKESNGKLAGDAAGWADARRTGWWLARPTGSSPQDTTVQGWVPSAYVEEIAVQAAPPPPPPASRPVPAAPAANGTNGGGRPVPPAKRPVARKPSTSQDPARDSMAGGLAEALRQRQAAMNSRKNDGGGW